MNNNTTNSNFTFEWPTGLTAQTKIALYSILLVWSLLGNLLVIAVVFCNENLKTNANYLIVNMAVSDLIIPLIGLPMAIVKAASEGSERPDEWLVGGSLGDALCKLCHVLVGISPFVSSFSLVTIAFHRFIAVVYPARREMLSSKTRWILISFTWIAAMALYSPYLYFLRLTDEWGYNMCILSWPPTFDRESAYANRFMRMVVGFLIPIISMISLYSIIQYRLKKNLKNVIELIERRAIRSRQQTNRRIFYMSLTIIVVFTICWCPLNVLLFLLFSFRSWFLSSILMFVFNYLLYLQTAINPCIYFVFLKDYRRGLKNVCCSIHSKITTFKLCRFCNTRRTRGGDSNQDPTCTSRHINTTTV